MTNDNQVDLSPRRRGLAAWNSYCDELRQMGEQLVADGEDLDDRSIMEGIRHLSRLSRISLELFLEHGDPLQPRMVNHERPTVQWGGPNPDNYYLRSAIDPRCNYRVWANVSDVEAAIFSLLEGDMHLEQYGVYSEMTLDDFTIENGQLEFVISNEPRDGNHMPMHQNAQNLTIRVYQSDPAQQSAPYVHIERIDPAPTGPRPFGIEQLERGLERSASWSRASSTYWRRYLERMAINGERNRLSAPACPPGGADNILYGGGIWRLDHDEVLLVECDVPDAKIWNFTIHTYPWFESGDHESRPSSLNHRTTHIDDDGIMRIVIAHSDPGSANWIDTENRTESLLTYRWIQTRNAPHPQARVLKASELRNELPNEHPAVSNAERQRRQSAASELLRERYR